MIQFQKKKYFIIKYQQKEIASLQERLCGGGWEVERARLTARLDQHEKDLRAAKEAHDMLSHHHEVAKKEVSLVIINNSRTNSTLEM